tara:strand:- start:531 stop:1016 length:486 start_codon:yes stop_codon:yes gene_type:complete
MANKKITALTELSAGDRATTDVLPIVDVSGTATTKKITVANLVSATSAGALSSYDFSGNAILGFDATLNDQTDNYTLQTSDAGKVVVMNKGSAVNLTVPASLGAGFTCSVVQKGAGQVTFVASSTTISNRQTHTKIAGQHGVATLISTADNVFVLAGDTAS